MTRTPTAPNCKGTCSTPKTKVLRYGAGMITLCAVCCAVPPVLIALGVIGVATGAYLSLGLKTALGVAILLAIGWVVVLYRRTQT